MSDIRTSQHAIQRMAQRGFKASDIDLIMAIGSEVDDGYLVLRKDREALERAARGFLQRVRHLEGKRLVVSEGCIVTAYHATHAEERRLLRRG